MGVLHQVSISLADLYDFDEDYKVQFYFFRRMRIVSKIEYAIIKWWSSTFCRKKAKTVSYGGQFF